MTIDTSKLKRYKPGYVHSNDGPGYISMLAREDGEYVRLEDVIAITIAIEQALTQQRGECVGYVSVDAVEHLRNGDAQAYTFIRAERSDCFPVAVYTTPQPSAEGLRELVLRWRDYGKDCGVSQVWGKCADELESLLGRGG